MKSLFLCNRMSSGSYHSEPIRQVLIPKRAEQFRPLEIPNVNDRIDQMALNLLGEARLEPVFQPSLFGYQPDSDDLMVVAQVRQNSWQYDWVVDLDIKGFFVAIDHDLRTGSGKALFRSLDLPLSSSLVAKSGCVGKRTATGAKSSHAERRSYQPAAGQPVYVLWWATSIWADSFGLSRMLGQSISKVYFSTKARSMT